LAIDIARLKARAFPASVQHYGARECILYALGIGVGQDPLDPAQLRFTYEQGLQMLPTMPVVLAYPGFWQREPDTGIDWRGVVHGEQRLTLHEPLSAQGTVLGRLRVDEVVDKGPGRGALLYTTRELSSPEDGRLLCTMQSTAFCRFDGGCAGHAAPAEAPVPPLLPIPERAPDRCLDFVTLPQAALLYRLNGDDNPLHADPAVARAAGFDRPILHGLCTYGVAGFAVTQVACGGDATRLRRLDVRFTAPVFPGETLTTELWLEGRNAARLRCRVEARDVTVLDRGHASWA
jgi:acyl dehydratase